MSTWDYITAERRDRDNPESPYYYSATRDQITRTWRGWVSMGSQVVETPQTFATKREALAAIKAQHPSR